MTDSSFITRLESKLVSEIEVVQAIYGCPDDEQETWAVVRFSLEHAESYLKAWREGRRRAWDRIQRQAAHLRRAAGDGDEEWILRLHRLGMGERTGLQWSMATTAGPSQWF